MFYNDCIIIEDKNGRPGQGKGYPNPDQTFQAEFNELLFISMGLRLNQNFMASSSVPTSSCPSILRSSQLSVPYFQLGFLLPRPYVPVFCRQNRYLGVSVSRLVVVVWYSSHGVFSRFLGTVVCSVEFLIVLDLIGFRFSTFNRKGSSVSKKGRDGHNSCTNCHSVTETCYPILSSLNPPILNFFSSVTVSVRPVIYRFMFTVLSQLSVSVT